MHIFSYLPLVDMLCIYGQVRPKNKCDLLDIFYLDLIVNHNLKYTSGLHLVHVFIIRHLNSSIGFWNDQCTLKLVQSFNNIWPRFWPFLGGEQVWKYNSVWISHSPYSHMLWCMQCAMGKLLDQCIYSWIWDSMICYY